MKLHWQHYGGLFTGVRGREILRSSPQRSSRKLAPRFGKWHHACGGDIPRWLKWESPAVDLIKERSPVESSTDRKSYGRILHDYHYPLPDRTVCSLRLCAERC